MLTQWVVAKPFALTIYEYPSAESFLFSYADKPCDLLLLDQAGAKAGAFAAMRRANHASFTRQHFLLRSVWKKIQIDLKDGRRLVCNKGISFLARDFNEGFLLSCRKEISHNSGNLFFATVAFRFQTWRPALYFS